MLFVVKPCRCVNVFYSHWYWDSGLFSLIKYWLDGDTWCFGCCAVTCHTAFHAFGLKTHFNTIMSRNIWICFSVFLNNPLSRKLELTFLFSLKGKYLNLFWHKRHSSVSLPYSPEVSAVPALLWRLVYQSTVSFCFFSQDNISNFFAHLLYKYTKARFSILKAVCKCTYRYFLLMRMNIYEIFVPAVA